MKNICLYNCTSSILKRFLCLVLVMFMLASGTSSPVHACGDVDGIVSNLTLDEKIGQMLMLDFRWWQQESEGSTNPFTSLNPEIRDIIINNHIGNVILLGESLQNVPKIVQLTHDLQQTTMRCNKGVPALISVDSEGGIVTRVQPGTCMPGNLALAATRNPGHAYNVGRILGKEAHALGLNCNLAPVLDVLHDEYVNPVPRDRCLGADPKLASLMGIEIIKGLHASGCAATGKHLPGKGRENADAHLTLPTIDLGLSELENHEFIPFRAAIDEGIDMIMTSHVQLPKVDISQCVSKKDGSKIYTPVTLSRLFVTDILRNRLGFKGVILTDAMDMKGISEHFGEVEAAIMSIKAGSDIVLMPVALRSKADVYKLEALISGIRRAVTTGEIPIEQINSSVRRIIQLKKDRGILNLDQYNVPVDIKTQNALKIVGCKENREIERQIASDAINVLKNDDNMLPFNIKANEKVLFITPCQDQIPSLEFAMNRLMTEGKIPSVQIDSYCYNKQREIDDASIDKIKKADKVVLLTQTFGKESLYQTDHWANALPRNVIELTKCIGKLGNLAVVSVSAPPYDAKNYIDVPVLLLTYGSLGMIDPTDAGNTQFKNRIGPNIPAAIDIIFGIATPRGELPMKA